MKSVGSGSSKEKKAEELAALPGVELPELPMPCITAYDTLQDCVAALVEREHECAAAAPG